MVKLLLLDIDGTLRPKGQSCVPPENVQAVRALQRRGVKVGIATGRGRANVPAELLGLENVVLTPHIGTNTHETREQMARACADRILMALDGRTPPNVVNGVLLS